MSPVSTTKKNDGINYFFNTAVNNPGIDRRNKFCQRTNFKCMNNKLKRERERETKYLTEVL